MQVIKSLFIRGKVLVLQRMLDHEWGREAFNRFPDLIDRFDFVDSPMSLWIELRLAFEDAYKTPRNEDLISRIYAYADWCCGQPEGATAADDLATAAVACFYEHIPESPESLADMPRWFKLSDVHAMKETFSYMVGEEGFQRILLVYQRAEQESKKQRRATRGEKSPRRKQ